MNKKQTTISNYIANRAYPSGDFFITLKQFIPDLDLNWLITGNGEVYLKNEPFSSGKLATLKKELTDLKSRERELTDALVNMSRLVGKTPLVKSKGVSLPGNLLLHQNRLWMDAKYTVMDTPQFVH